MRKRLITQIPQDFLPLDEGWLNLDGAAVVEVTSEDMVWGLRGLVSRDCAPAVEFQQYARSRTIGSNCQGSTSWNWSLCPTSAEGRLAPRSRVCGCLNFAARRIAAQPIFSGIK